MSKEKEKEEKDQSAEEIAKIMVENMKANMADPDFWAKREEINYKVIKEFLKKRKERREAKRRNKKQEKNHEFHSKRTKYY